MRTGLGRAGKAAWLFCVFHLFAMTAQAQSLMVPAGASLNVSGGRVELANGAFSVAGTFGLGAGELRSAGAVRIASGGTADFGSGVATVFGDWENRGIFNAGTSRIELRDGPAASAVLGISRFANLSLVSAAGKHYRFESGLTQSVSGQLQIQGQGPPIQVDATAPGSVASLNLLPGGTQAIANVGVSDVYATGQHLAPAQTNQGGNGNDDGWFGGGGPVTQPVPVPALGWPMLLALAAGMLWISTRSRVRQFNARGRSCDRMVLSRKRFVSALPSPAAALMALT